MDWDHAASGYPQATAVPSMSVLPDELARLYGLPLEEFVVARDQSVRAARKAGDKETASAIAALRKPTVAAWVVNQLARRNRHDVDLLLDSGKRLLDAQRTSLEGGGRDQLDAARTSLDASVTRLSAAARELLHESAGEAMLARIAETLRAAALSPEGRPLLASGTLAKELRETGWDLLADLAPARPEPRSRRSRGVSEPEDEDASGQARDAEREAEEQRRQETRRELQAARQLRAELTGKLREARRDEQKTLRLLERAREEIRAIEAELGEVDAAIDRTTDA